MLDAKRIETNQEPKKIEFLGDGSYYYNYDIKAKVVTVSPMNDEDEEHECHCGHHHEDGEECHCGHHHHNHDVNEYGITTFTYMRREPMDRKKFYEYIEKPWPKKIIRVKGITYFKDDNKMSYMFEQAGTLKELSEAGLWLAAEDKKFQQQVLAANPDIAKEWDEEYGEGEFDRIFSDIIIGIDNADNRICFR